MAKFIFFLAALVFALALASGFKLNKANQKPLYTFPKGDPLGHLPRRSSSKVVGGQDATLGQFPYQVRLFYYVTAISGFICGGSIISEDTILTAGHCVQDHTTDPGGFELTGGGVRTNVQEPEDQVLRGLIVIQHEGYVSATTEHDIALIRLDGSYTFNTFVNKICVPPQLWAATGTSTISGFGKTSGTGQVATHLQYAEVDIISDAACVAIFGSISVHDNDICAGPGPLGQTSCNGDSGGPLANSGRVAGIVSRGYSSCDDATIYTETSYYSDWIEANSGVVPC